MIKPTHSDKTKIIKLITILNSMVVIGFLIFGIYQHHKTKEYTQQLEQCLKNK